MSLSAALSIAQSSLFNTSRQTTVVSQNISNATNPDYARRSAVLASSANGARVVDIRRAANEMLFRQNLSALSSWSGQNALLAGTQQLALTVNGADNVTSPATAIGDFQVALQLYSAAPSDRNIADSAIEAARQVVNSLDEGSSAIQTFRTATDVRIVDAVKDLNSLLDQFDQANRAIVSGTRSGRDVTDELDRRDALLKKISHYMPVTAISRGDNDMVLTTQNGTTLYETTPRKVTFMPTTAYAPGSTGNQIYVDGVPLVAGKGGNTDASGSLAAMLQLRDSVAVTMQAQLDEIARGLIAAFAETDQSGTGLLTMPGLFTWDGATGMPADGTLVNGLAGMIKVNPAMDPQAGGNPFLLRDGGANGTEYVANGSTPPSAAFTELLLHYSDQLDKPIAFEPAAGIEPQASVVTYSASAISWFEAIRKDASGAEEAKNALLVRTSEALSNDTGVNMDYEMSLLLDLEHSYEASARLLTVIDEMLAALLAAVR